MEIQGPRVLEGNGRIVGAVIEGLRYNPEKKYGYHGGVSPQEVLCPLGIFKPSQPVLDGYEPTVLRPPVWWNVEAEGPSIDELRKVISTATRTPTDLDGRPVLFDEKAKERRPIWIDQLLETAVLKQQRALAGRSSLSDEEVAEFLVLMDAGNGVVAIEVIREALDIGPARCRSKLAALAKLLNIDAYPVLRIEDDGTVRLDRSLVRSQFEVEA